LTLAAILMLEQMMQKAMAEAGSRKVNFLEPHGEAALVGADSVSWRVFKNPVTLFIGGVTAVILEFADPRVRSGVWDHSTFRVDPVGRMKRTGLAAMVTVYGAASVAERMIAGVNRMHDRISGETGAGLAYRASDPELLDWVHATASFGFLEAYSAFAAPLAQAERDEFYREGRTAAALYGAVGAPASQSEMYELVEKFSRGFEASPVIFEFLDIVSSAPAIPQPFRPLQKPMVRAAISLVPADIRRRLNIESARCASRVDRALVRVAAALADRIAIGASPPVQACARLGLPKAYLFSGSRRTEAFAPSHHPA